MAVYTPLARDVLDAWLVVHDVGVLIDIEGIAAGIENSNFFVTTRANDRERRFVLTLFERLSDDALPYYLSLMEHLATRGVPCPAPIPDRAGALASPLAGKPAALVTRLEGRSALHPTAAHCALMGAELARMHLAATGYAACQPNPRGIDWWQSTAMRVGAFLDASQRALLDDEIAFQTKTWSSVTADLPRSAIHADLFRDNALFVDDADGAIRLGGIIDFYFAGDDVWVLDLAVCLNDWCVDLDTGAFASDTADAFITAYEAARPLGVDERRAMPQLLRAAALRFWLSRVDDLHRPRPAALLTPHDPGHFERILRRRRDEMRDASGPFAGPFASEGT